LSPSVMSRMPRRIRPTPPIRFTIRSWSMCEIRLVAFVSPARDRADFNPLKPPRILCIPGYFSTPEF
jgi:hypothetical protein